MVLLERPPPEDDPSVIDRINKAIDRLNALREGDRAVVDLIACGRDAVAPLRAFLFSRDPSGLFQPRCQAVEALAALGAKDVLRDFLAHPRLATDLVEQTGEDAVANSVARALIGWPSEEVFSLLMAVARRKLLAGVIEALGDYRRPEAMSVFIAALAEDFCRPEAEDAFRKLGRCACPCLLRCALDRSPSFDIEPESSRRRRRSALKLFAELDGGATSPEELAPLIMDPDPWVAMIASSICLPRMHPRERPTVITRIVNLLDEKDWRLRAEAEDLLILHFPICRSVVENRIAQASPLAAASLRRVIAAISPGRNVMDRKVQQEPNLSQLLADPVLWMMMKADRVGESDLMGFITAAAGKRGEIRKPTASSNPTGKPGVAPTEYRPGVGIMLLNGANEVFVGCRKDVGANAWQMPQGGIDGKEDPRTAAFRELKEEIGTDKAEILAESDRWLFYDLPAELIGKAWHGKWRGQRQKWFVMRFLGTDSDIDIKTRHPEFSAWKWVRFDELPDLIVSFKRALYLELLEDFSSVSIRRYQR